MNNIKPKDRSERVKNNIKKQIANRSKDNIERAFLQDRVGMFNKPVEKARINDPDPMSDIYISEGERFNKDFASNEYQKRCKDHEKKKERYQTLQSILFDRERKRWEKMDYDYLRNENRIMMNKERQLVGRKNHPGMAFNPITLQYDNSVQGEILKKRDEESKYRALMRASNIDKHANIGYNILTGEDRVIMQKRMQNEIDPNIYKQNYDAIMQMNKKDRNVSYFGSNIYQPSQRTFSPIEEIKQNSQFNINDRSDVGGNNGVRRTPQYMPQEGSQQFGQRRTPQYMPQDGQQQFSQRRTPQYSNDNQYNQDRQYNRDPQYQQQQYNPEPQYNQDNRQFSRDPQYQPQPQQQQYNPESQYNQDRQYNREPQYQPQPQQYNNDPQYNPDRQFSPDPQQYQPQYNNDPQYNQNRQYEPQYNQNMQFSPDPQYNQDPQQYYK